MVNRSIAQPLLILQRHLKTGDLLRSCGRAPCGYLLAWRGFMGMVPAFWGVEFPQENDQGTLTGWFYGTLGSDPVKIISLNQPGRKDSVAAFEGAGRLPCPADNKAQIVQSGAARGARPSCLPKSRQSLVRVAVCLARAYRLCGAR